MLYCIGTYREATALPVAFPADVKQKLLCSTAYLDSEYGAKRNYLESGGYSLIAQTYEDLLKAKEVVDFEVHPCEWVNRLDGDFLSALFVINDDFTISLFMPVEIAPKAILKELED